MTHYEKFSPAENAIYWFVSANKHTARAARMDAMGYTHIAAMAREAARRCREYAQRNVSLCVWTPSGRV